MSGVTWVNISDYISGNTSPLTISVSSDSSKILCSLSGTILQVSDSDGTPGTATCTISMQEGTHPAVITTQTMTVREIVNSGGGGGGFPQWQPTPIQAGDCYYYFGQPTYTTGMPIVFYFACPSLENKSFEAQWYSDSGTPLTVMSGTIPSGYANVSYTPMSPLKGYIRLTADNTDKLIAPFEVVPKYKGYIIMMLVAIALIILFFTVNKAVQPKKKEREVEEHGNR
jgi:hypothetical protein